MNNNIVRFSSISEASYTFNLVITAIGKSPATLVLATTIKVVDCSTGNSISGGSWQTSRLYTDITPSEFTDLTIAPFTYAKTDCGLN